MRRPLISTDDLPSTNTSTRLRQHFAPSRLTRMMHGNGNRRKTTRHSWVASLGSLLDARTLLRPLQLGHLPCLTTLTNPQYNTSTRPIPVQHSDTGQVEHPSKVLLEPFRHFPALAEVILQVRGVHDIKAVRSAPAFTRTSLIFSNLFLSDGFPLLANTLLPSLLPRIIAVSLLIVCCRHPPNIVFPICVDLKRSGNPS